MVKQIFTEFRLSEISAVTFPAQKGAKMTIMKSADPLATRLTSLVLKAYEDGDSGGAKTFTEILQCKEEQEKAWKVRNELWPIFDALNESIGSILSDAALTLAQKGKKVDTSVNDFLGAVRAKFPDVEEEIMKALNEAGLSGAKGTEMSKELEDQVKKLTTDLATSQAALATATALAALPDDHKAFYAKMDDKAKDEFLKATPETRAQQVTKSREGDEEIKVEGNVIRKSDVGATMFAVIKSQQAQIAASQIAIKAAERAGADAVFKSRAKVELDGFPGTEEDKVAILKAIETDPVAVKAFKALITAAVKARDLIFKELGHGDEITEEIGGVLAEGSAEAKINKLAKEVQKSDAKLSFEQAVAKVLEAHPELYSDYDAEATNEIDDPGND